MTACASGPVAQREVVARHTDDESTMRLALAAARRAGLAGEPPIGAALVRDGQVLAIAANSIISSLDITAHAEINLIRDACRATCWSHCCRTHGCILKRCRSTQTANLTGVRCPSR